MSAPLDLAECAHGWPAGHPQACPACPEVSAEPTPLAKTLSRRGWIGVDLDGTLAEYNGWNPVIGAPIPLMVDRVKAWIADGEDVRIFTARGSGDTDPHARAVQRGAIQKWCSEHIGKVLVITATKDIYMKSLYDDRAFRVEHNTGRVQEDVPSALTLSNYMKLAAKLAVYPVNYASSYLTLGLAGETGEMVEAALSHFVQIISSFASAGKAADAVKKGLRDPTAWPTHKKKLRAELGDVAWYWSQLCHTHGFVPEEILQENLDKLNARKAAGTLKTRPEGAE